MSPITKKPNGSTEINSIRQYTCTPKICSPIKEEQSSGVFDKGIETEETGKEEEDHDDVEDDDNDDSVDNEDDSADDDQDEGENTVGEREKTGRSVVRNRKDSGSDNDARNGDALDINVISATPESLLNSSEESETQAREASVSSTPVWKRLDQIRLLYGVGRRPSFKSPKVRRSDITSHRPIGQGGFGTVYEGKASLFFSHTLSSYIIFSIRYNTSNTMYYKTNSQQNQSKNC